MTQRVSCGFSWFNPLEKNQTTSSQVMRITAIALGIILAAAGILVLCGVPGISQLGTAAGWGGVSIGALITLVGSTLKCPKVQLPQKKQDSGKKNKSKEATTTPTAIPAEKNEKTAPSSSTIISSSSSRQSPFPLWLGKALCEAKAAVLNINSSSVTDAELKTRCKKPVTLFSYQNTVGIFLRLQVEHISVATSDLISVIPLTALKNPPPSTTTPFNLFATFWKPYIESDLWILSSSQDDGPLNHRNSVFDRSNILGDNRFNTSFEEAIEAAIATLINTEKQDDLPEEHRYNLAWIMLRLLNNQPVQIREWSTLFHNFSLAPVGYWKITLAEK